MKMFFYSEEEGTRDRRAQWGVCCQGDKLFPRAPGVRQDFSVLCASYCWLLRNFDIPYLESAFIFNAVEDH